jgi:predicted DCC family thiol-disulfide oxidoreductase YuxK
MKRLFVIYDGECAMCCRCRNWLGRQPAFVQMEFIPLQAADLKERFPGIERFNPGERMLVIGDDGDVYRGASAWVMCLWALQEHRSLALRMAKPILLPFARVACELVSENRYLISRLIFRQDSRTLARDLAGYATPAGPQDACACP